LEDDPVRRALDAAGVEPAGTEADLLVVGEGALSPDSASVVAQRLGHGGRVLLLAQPASAAEFAPVRASMMDLRTEWGSTPFIYTTDSPGISALPAGAVLTTEVLEVSPDVVWSGLGDPSVQVETLVGVTKSPPAPVRGTVVGRLAAGDGLLTVCQLQLTDQAIGGSVLATTLLRELVTYAGSTREDA
jgi:hypothetical protein